MITCTNGARQYCLGYIMYVALGYLYQTKSCRALEGIMELVVFLENKLRASERPAEIFAQQGEELPVTRR
eukprot:11647440-Heterocapsa_arctica.AAC.1